MILYKPIKVHQKVIFCLIFMCMLLITSGYKAQHKGDINFSAVLFKGGFSVNPINKTLWQKLNRGINPDVLHLMSNYNANPSLAISMLKFFNNHIGVYFNSGYLKTQLNYTYKSRILDFGNNFKTQEHYIVKYKHNIIALELSPALKIKNTILVAGPMLAVTNPMVKANVKEVNLANNETIRQYDLKDRPQTNYFLYSSVTIIQLFEFKTHQLFTSISYFGFLKKYDSAININLGLLI